MENMAQDSALRHALERAASYGIVGARHCVLRSGQDGLRFVQEQIAGTVLDRRITFLADGATRFSCDVAGGRLMRFAAEDGALSGKFDDLADTKAVAEALAKFSALVSRSFDGAVAAQARTERLTENGGVCGLPSDRITEAFGLSAISKDARPWFERFVTEAGAMIIAAGYLEDGVLNPLISSDNQRETLADCVETLLPEIEALTEETTSEAFVALARGTGPVTLVATRDDLTLIAIAKPEAQPALTRLWYSLRPN
ncbi:hypothetical protein [Aestuariicoccus sp. MJ-SS9]|uniref:hypothetical protein n=1 Tax=Aestuariicoccus sp. MJ-SS9 TaxID=3079855 RepID=UPI00290A2BC3|nr:hypothetical protein [Aestuariicoccus sp. MJ-SS9]MDU8913550.1 hypothetical protein [Aestuariicoccus sp. MJ-SS9]